MTNSTSPLHRVTRGILIATSGYLATHWLLFTVLGPGDVSALKAAAASLIGADGAATLRQLFPHVLTSAFLAVGAALIMLRHLPGSNRQTGIGATLDRYAHWLMPAALALTVIASARLYGVDVVTSPLTLSEFFAHLVRGPLDATLGTMGAWQYGDDVPGRWHVPFGYFLTMHPRLWVLAGLLPFVALVALWRKVRALSQPLPSADGGQLVSTVASTKAIAAPKPPEFLPHG